MLARYLFELKWFENLKNFKQKSGLSSVIEYKLRKFAGRYNKIFSKDIYQIAENFHANNSEDTIKKFIGKIEGMKEAKYISTIDFWDIVWECKVNIDWK